MAAMKMQTDVGVALVEASDEVDDERAVGDHLTEVAEIICHTLESPVVVGDGEVTLVEVAELGIKVECPGFAIAEELRFDGDPGSASGGAA
jgi:hypothetical protein